MRKLLLGALIGSSLVYFFDSAKGAERRRQAATLWKSQKGTVLDAARSTAGKVSSVSQDIGEKVAEIRPSSGEGTNGTVAGEGLAGRTTSH